MFSISDTDNLGFVKLSKYVNDSNQIIVNWNAVKNWLFNEYTGANISKNVVNESGVLKAFIRTQIYRPLYFKHDNYDGFTSDTSKYHISTNKYYVNHNHENKQLYLPITDATNKRNSGLGDTSEYVIEQIEYKSQTNVLEYDVKYKPIPVVDNKFMFQDVQFFTVR